MRRIRERKRHIPRAIEPTTRKSVLDPLNTLHLLPLEQILPCLSQRTRETTRWRDMGTGEGSEHGFENEEEADGDLEDSGGLQLAFGC